MSNIKKRLISICLVFVMVFAVGALSGCSADLVHWLDGIAEQVYIAVNEDNPTVAGIDALLAELSDIRADIIRRRGNNSPLLVRVAYYQGQLRPIRAQLLRAERLFPSPIERFEAEDFDEEFFEDYTLVLVLFTYPSAIDGHVSFYTVYAEDGKINFLTEITTLGRGGAAAGIDYLFAVIIPNYLLEKYSIGESSFFYRYDYPPANRWDPTTWVLNCRDWLSGIEAKSIEHRVGFIHNKDNRVLRFVQPHGEVVVITSETMFNDTLESAEWW